LAGVTICDQRHLAAEIMAKPGSDSAFHANLFRADRSRELLVKLTF
jgi:hypothetical protein